MTVLLALLVIAQAQAAPAAAPAPAAGAPKQTPPEAGPPKDFRVPAAHKLTLDNGLAVTFVQYGTTGWPAAVVQYAAATLVVGIGTVAFGAFHIEWTGKVIGGLAYMVLVLSIGAVSLPRQPSS